MGGNNGPRWKSNTRYGFSHGKNMKLNMGEERFMWQKPPNEFDAIYKVKLDKQVRDLHFGTSTRADWESTMKNKRDSFNPNAGPGSYKVDKLFLISSESINKEAPRFKDAPRESMVRFIPYLASLVALLFHSPTNPPISICRPQKQGPLGLCTTLRRCTKTA